jgi:acid-sensing ion channel, other
MVNETLKQCGCVKFTMPREKNTKVCDLDKIKCYVELERSWSIVDNDCKCLPPCTNIEYEYAVKKTTKTSE